MASKDANHDDEMKEFMDYVIKLHVSNSTDNITESMKQKFDVLKGMLADDMNKVIGKTNEICDRVNHCAKATGDMKESLEETVFPICQTVRDANARAQSSERTTRMVLGLLGSQERKRRKVDTDEISRLRNEIGIMRRQSRDRDAEYTEMIGTLSDRVEELLCQMEDMRNENKNREDILLREMADSKANQEKMNANQEKILALLAARL